VLTVNFTIHILDRGFDWAGFVDIRMYQYRRPKRCESGDIGSDVDLFGKNGLDGINICHDSVMVDSC